MGAFEIRTGLRNEEETSQRQIAIYWCRDSRLSFDRQDICIRKSMNPVVCGSTKNGQNVCGRIIEKPWSEALNYTARCSTSRVWAEEAGTQLDICHK